MDGGPSRSSSKAATLAASTSNNIAEENQLWFISPSVIRIGVRPTPALCYERMDQGTRPETGPVLDAAGCSRAMRHFTESTERLIGDLNQSDCTSFSKAVLAQRRISRSSAVTSGEVLRSANAR